jgi:predicted membrane protein
MVMRGLNPIIAVLAIIGAVVVLGIVLKVAFSLLWLAIVVGMIIVAVYFVQGVMGKRQ